MIQYQREQQQTIPDSQVKIIGVGGAGSNMIDRVALDGMESAELLALNSDSRNLTSSVATEKIQLGAKLTMGLGCGGDPDLGLQAAQEVETEIRDALRDRKMIFICVGLGGGTGSGAAPLVTRIARELGAFVVVFATMPFAFEGKRRRQQAETSLNELSVIANALVTFENARMGELVLASQGIHEAFAAADSMVSESIQAVTRLVVRPGIINVGLDDLMSALRSNRSRCLFGSGLAHGENRSQQALKNALNSPLLDKGRLLKSARTALVHICGGNGMTLYEVELLMRELSKQVPEDAHILFGAAVDETMGDALSVTIISSLPESELNTQQVPAKQATQPALIATETIQLTNPSPESIEISQPDPEPSPDLPALDHLHDLDDSAHQKTTQDDGLEVPQELLANEEELLVDEEDAILPDEVEATPDEPALVDQDSSQAPPQDEEVKLNLAEDDTFPPIEEESEESDSVSEEDSKYQPVAKPAPVIPGSQSELELDGGPRGKFEGEAPNLIDGEDLDIPPYLRNKR